MKVTLIDYTGSGHDDPSNYAAAVLLFTKNTRLQMSPGLFDEIRRWPAEKKVEELQYMANTIPSSWEFVNYTFMIEGVSRAFTHQFVRTRTASYAQQTMRVLNVSQGRGWDYLTGPTVAHTDQKQLYNGAMEEIAACYRALIARGVKIEDARGILPTNILTNIVMACNMRTLVELVRKRSSPRTQGEYRDVLEAMKAAALEVHPWLAFFIARTQDQATKDLDAEINKLPDPEQRTRMLKLVDQLRSS